MQKIKVVTLDEMRQHYSASQMADMLYVSGSRIYQALRENSAIVEWKGKFPKGEPVRLLYPREPVN